MKKVIYRTERDSTKAGRTINALLALLTANRYALIFTLRITLVKRNYQPEAMRKRAKENLLIFLILFPIVLGIVIGMEKCSKPDITKTILPDSIEIKSVGRFAPSRDSLP